METKNNDCKSQLYFTQPAPPMLVKKVVLDPMYEKAFLSREDENKSEFCQNTTTWD